MANISLKQFDQSKLFGSQSLKAVVVSVAAGLRHSLAVTGLKRKKQLHIGACFHEALNTFTLFIVSCYQTRAVCISGAAGF